VQKPIFQLFLQNIHFPLSTKQYFVQKEKAAFDGGLIFPSRIRKQNNSYLYNISSLSEATLVKAVSMSLSFTPK
jgi:hypothetical protein